MFFRLCWSRYSVCRLWFLCNSTQTSGKIFHASYRVWKFLGKSRDNSQDKKPYGQFFCCCILWSFRSCIHFSARINSSTTVSRVQSGQGSSSKWFPAQPPKSGRCRASCARRKAGMHSHSSDLPLPTMQPFVGIPPLSDLLSFWIGHPVFANHRLHSDKWIWNGFDFERPSTFTARLHMMDRANYFHSLNRSLGNLGVVHQVIHTVQAPQRVLLPHPKGPINAITSRG